MNITVYSGPPGSQKTRTMLRGILETAGRYLLAAPRIGLIEEHSEWLQAESEAHGIALIVETLHSGQKRSDTARRISEACRRLSDTPHTVVLITHESLRSIDLSPFTEQAQPWHVRIDEVPDAVTSGSFSATAAAAYLQQVYDLTPSDADGWWRATLKPDAPGPNALLTDTHLSGLVAFDKRARALNGGALVSIGDWRDATLPRRKVDWFAAWTPAALAGFASVVIAGANFETSLCGLASRRLDGDRAAYEHIRLPAERTTRPAVVIRFFTQGHTGSTEWWAEGHGKRCLHAVLCHLKTVPDLGYYTGNHDVLSYFACWLDHAAEVPPKQAGTNRLIAHTSCAAIYSNKPQPSDAAVRLALGVTAEEIGRARETEDLLQFVMRGAIRDPSFAGTYTIYVYDRVQAEALRRYVLDGGITPDVQVEGIEEAGIMDVVRPRARGHARNGEMAEQDTFEQRQEGKRKADAARKRRDRAEERALRQAAGTYRPRGRPRRGDTQVPL